MNGEKGPRHATQKTGSLANGRIKATKASSRYIVVSATTASLPALSSDFEFPTNVCNQNPPFWRKTPTTCSWNSTKLVLPNLREAQEELLLGQPKDAGAAQRLIEELTCRFPAHDLLDALGIVCPPYWKQTDAEKSFRKDLDVIKKNSGEPKWIGEDENKRLVPALLDCFQLELQ